VWGLGIGDFVCGETAPEDIYIPVINFIEE
jgi:hypothetical protein